MENTWNVYKLSNTDGLRRLLRSYHALEALAANGDIDSATILCDLNESMQTAGSIRILSVRQNRAIKLLLIEGNNSDSVASTMGIHQRRVFDHVAQGLSHMLRYMQHRETIKWGRGKLIQPWQYEYVLHNSQLSPKQLANDIGKSLDAIYKMRWELRRRGFIIAGRYNTSRGSKKSPRLETRSLPGIERGAVEESA